MVSYSFFGYNMIATEATRILKCATYASCKNSEGLEGNLALYTPIFYSSN